MFIRTDKFPIFKFVTVFMSFSRVLCGHPLSRTWTLWRNLAVRESGKCSFYLPLLGVSEGFLGVRVGAEWANMEFWPQSMIFLLIFFSFFCCNQFHSNYLSKPKILLHGRFAQRLSFSLILLKAVLYTPSSKSDSPPIFDGHPALVRSLISLGLQTSWRCSHTLTSFSYSWPWLWVLFTISCELF